MRLLLILISLIALVGCNSKEKAAEIARLEREQFVKDSIHKADSIETYLASLPKVYRDSLMPGEGVFQVMERMNIGPELTMKLINKLRFEVELINLTAGERFTGVYTPDSTKLIEFRYKPNRITEHILKIDSTSDSIYYELDQKETTIKHRLITGSLSAGSSLNQALLESGLPQSITQVVNGILLCKISFRTDARVNDNFYVILQEEFFNDTIVPGRSKVLYTSYDGTRAGFHEAYRYQDNDPKSTYNAHYTVEGEALIHSGLRYPVDRIHISSTYGMRIHPVTGRRKMHNGVDYAGPTGTPIYAVAPGKVVTSGYDKYSGNKVAIRHADGSTTYYLHLSKRLVSVGQQVRSRQLIAKMGNTGRSTGPHLHFGVKKPNGRWMNPLKKRMIATPKLSGDRLARLKEQITEIQGIRVALEAGQTPAVASYKENTNDSTETVSEI